MAKPVAIKAKASGENLLGAVTVLGLSRQMSIRRYRLGAGESEGRDAWETCLRRRETSQRR
jgi:hypothetical protein